MVILLNPVMVPSGIFSPTELPVFFAVTLEHKKKCEYKN
jgi:hypothetical protein